MRMLHDVATISDFRSKPRRCTLTHTFAHDNVPYDVLDNSVAASATESPTSLSEAQTLKKGAKKDKNVLRFVK